MSEELRACPFCGESDKVTVADNTGPKLCTNAHAFVMCNSCHTDGPEKDSVELAVAAWNTRPALIDHLEADGGVEPVAYRHTLNMEGGQTMVRYSEWDGTSEHDPRVTAFGIPGRDYSEEYPVTVEPLYVSALPVLGVGR